MSPSLLFFPVFVQIMLTFTLLVAMGRARGRFLKETKTNPAKISLGQDLWPPEVKQVANCFHNQLELPILFYAAILFGIALNKADGVILALGWIFAISRILHAIIHTGSNYVPRRAAVYAAGALSLFLMWIWLFVKVVV